MKRLQGLWSIKMIGWGSWTLPPSFQWPKQSPRINSWELRPKTQGQAPMTQTYRRWNKNQRTIRWERKRGLISINKNISQAPATTTWEEKKRGQPGSSILRKEWLLRTTKTKPRMDSITKSPTKLWTRLNTWTSRIRWSSVQLKVRCTALCTQETGLRRRETGLRRREWWLDFHI